MLIYILILLLLLSFTVHTIILFRYIKTRKAKYLNLFLGTVVTNMIIALSLSILALSKPGLIRRINLQFFMWLLSGFISVLLISLQVMIMRNIYKRSRQPEWYHLNYFGKKVYEKGIIKQSEFLGFVAAFPFILFIGAYFFALLANLILYGHI